MRHLLNLSLIATLTFGTGGVAFAAAKKKASSSSSSVASCIIKGNISSPKKEKIYHLQTCASYKQTIIDTAAGERWFCSEQEALAAGWRKALNCKK